MGTQAGVGLSHQRNPRAAGKQAAERALLAGGIERPDFVFLFASVGYDQQALLDSVRQATGRAPLIGCSGEGIIGEGETDESNFTVGVMATRSDEIRFLNGNTAGLMARPRGAGHEVAATIQPHLGDDALALFAFADGLTFNFDQFNAGLDETLQLDRLLPLLGGTAGDNYRMERTYQYCDDAVLTDSVTFALCSGRARIAWAVNHGCSPLGSERQVTRSVGNVIHEIDGRPVLDVLREYVSAEQIGDWAKTFTSIPLGFRAPDEMRSYDEYVIRVMTANDAQTGSIRIPSEVATGTPVWIMRRDPEKIGAGVARLGEELKHLTDGAPLKLVFHFDCAGRGNVVLREQQKTEHLQYLQRTLGQNVPWIGFYTYGELGPVGLKNCFHNWTAVLAAIY